MVPKYSLEYAPSAIPNKTIPDIIKKNHHCILWLFPTPVSEKSKAICSIVKLIM
ncbi:hypothetical protein [Spiroplasma clarkii]|uniref:hypothetical protein n=1 Tax=Spiroplasma clarkii TaxID=2139 RepID=UPI00164980CF|nr:hypothetical protein [Spiroplasma clarkii]